MRIISHDPYTRMELVREIVEIPKSETTSCAWCGNEGMRVMEKRTAWYLYRYHNSSPSNSLSPIADGKLFCCIGCMRSYTM